jgi:hypothetical protein
VIDRSVWARFTHDPRDPQVAYLRASDRDRDVVRDVLGEAFAEGRLTSEELDERIDRLTVSRTLGELPGLMGDLVPMHPAYSGSLVPRDLHTEAVRRYRQQRQGAIYGFLTPSLICWAIWAAVMFGEFPWPVFVTLAGGLHLVRVLTTRAEIVERIERDLERKERKRLEYLERRNRRRLPPPFGLPGS